MPTDFDEFYTPELTIDLDEDDEDEEEEEQGDPEPPLPPLNETLSSIEGGNSGNESDFSKSGSGELKVKLQGSGSMQRIYTIVLVDSQELSPDEPKRAEFENLEEPAFPTSNKAESLPTSTNTTSNDNNNNNNNNGHNNFGNTQPNNYSGNASDAVQTKNYNTNYNNVGEASIETSQIENNSAKGKPVNLILDTNYYDEPDENPPIFPPPAPVFASHPYPRGPAAQVWKNPLAARTSANGNGQSRFGKRRAEREGHRARDG